MSKTLDDLLNRYYSRQDIESDTSNQDSKPLDSFYGGKGGKVKQQDINDIEVNTEDTISNIEEMEEKGIEEHVDDYGNKITIDNDDGNVAISVDDLLNFNDVTNNERFKKEINDKNINDLYKLINHSNLDEEDKKFLVDFTAKNLADGKYNTALFNIANKIKQNEAINEAFNNFSLHESELVNDVKSFNKGLMSSLQYIGKTFGIESDIKATENEIIDPYKEEHLHMKRMEAEEAFERGDYGEGLYHYITAIPEATQELTGSIGYLVPSIMSQIITRNPVGFIVTTSLLGVGRAKDALDQRLENNFGIDDLSTSEKGIVYGLGAVNELVQSYVELSLLGLAGNGVKNKAKQALDKITGKMFNVKNSEAIKNEASSTFTKIFKKLPKDKVVKTFTSTKNKMEKLHKTLSKIKSAGVIGAGMFLEGALEGIDQALYNYIVENNTAFRESKIMDGVDVDEQDKKQIIEAFIAGSQNALLLTAYGKAFENKYNPISFVRADENLRKIDEEVESQKNKILNGIDNIVHKIETSDEESAKNIDIKEALEIKSEDDKKQLYKFLFGKDPNEEPVKEAKTTTETETTATDSDSSTESETTDTTTTGSDTESKTETSSFKEPSTYEEFSKMLDEDSDASKLYISNKIAEKLISISTLSSKERNKHVIEHIGDYSKIIKFLDHMVSTQKDNKEVSELVKKTKSNLENIILSLTHELINGLGKELNIEDEDIKGSDRDAKLKDLINKAKELNSLIDSLKISKDSEKIQSYKEMLAEIANSDLKNGRELMIQKIKTANKTLEEVSSEIEKDGLDVKIGDNEIHFDSIEDFIKKIKNTSSKEELEKILAGVERFVRSRYSKKHTLPFETELLRKVIHEENIKIKNKLLKEIAKKIEEFNKDKPKEEQIDLDSTKYEMIDHMLNTDDENLNIDYLGEFASEKRTKTDRTVGSYKFNFHRFTKLAKKNKLIYVGESEKQVGKRYDKKLKKYVYDKEPVKVFYSPETNELFYVFKNNNKFNNMAYREYINPNSKESVLELNLLKVVLNNNKQLLNAISRNGKILYNGALYTVKLNESNSKEPVSAVLLENKSPSKEDKEGIFELTDKKLLELQDSISNILSYVSYLVNIKFPTAFTTQVKYFTVKKIVDEGIEDIQYIGDSKNELQNKVLVRTKAGSEIVINYKTNKTGQTYISNIYEIEKYDETNSKKQFFNIINSNQYKIVKIGDTYYQVTTKYENGKYVNNYKKISAIDIKEDYIKEAEEKTINILVNDFNTITDYLKKENLLDSLSVNDNEALLNKESINDYSSKDNDIEFNEEIKLTKYKDNKLEEIKKPIQLRLKRIKKSIKSIFLSIKDGSLINYLKSNNLLHNKKEEEVNKLLEIYKELIKKFNIKINNTLTIDEKDKDELYKLLLQFGNERVIKSINGEQKQIEFSDEFIESMIHNSLVLLKEIFSYESQTNESIARLLGYEDYEDALRNVENFDSVAQQFREKGFFANGIASTIGLNILRASGYMIDNKHTSSESKELLLRTLGQFAIGVLESNGYIEKSKIKIFFDEGIEKSYKFFNVYKPTAKSFTIFKKHSDIDFNEIKHEKDKSTALMYVSDLYGVSYVAKEPVYDTSTELKPIYEFDKDATKYRGTSLFRAGVKKMANKIYKPNAFAEKLYNIWSQGEDGRLKVYKIFGYKEITDDTPIHEKESLLSINEEIKRNVDNFFDRMDMLRNGFKVNVFVSIVGRVYQDSIINPQSNKIHRHLVDTVEDTKTKKKRRHKLTINSLIRTIALAFDLGHDKERIPELIDGLKKVGISDIKQVNNHIIASVDKSSELHEILKKIKNDNFDEQVINYLSSLGEPEIGSNIIVLLAQQYRPNIGKIAINTNKPSKLHYEVDGITEGHMIKLFIMGLLNYTKKGAIYVSDKSKQPSSHPVNLKNGTIDIYNTTSINVSINLLMSMSYRIIKSVNSMNNNSDNLKALSESAKLLAETLKQISEIIQKEPNKDNLIEFILNYKTIIFDKNHKGKSVTIREALQTLFIESNLQKTYDTNISIKDMVTLDQYMLLSSLFDKDGNVNIQILSRKQAKQFATPAGYGSGMKSIVNKYLYSILMNSIISKIYSVTSINDTPIQASKKLHEHVKSNKHDLLVLKAFKRLFNIGDEYNVNEKPTYGYNLMLEPSEANGNLTYKKYFISSSPVSIKIFITDLDEHNKMIEEAGNKEPLQYEEIYKNDKFEEIKQLAIEYHNEKDDKKKQKLGEKLTKEFNELVINNVPLKKIAINTSEFANHINKYSKVNDYSGKGVFYGTMNAMPLFDEHNKTIQSLIISYVNKSIEVMEKKAKEYYDKELKNLTVEEKRQLLERLDSEGLLPRTQTTPGIKLTPMYETFNKSDGFGMLHINNIEKNEKINQSITDVVETYNPKPTLGSIMIGIGNEAETMMEMFVDRGVEPEIIQEIFDAMVINPENESFISKTYNNKMSSNLMKVDALNPYLDRFNRIFNINSLTELFKEKYSEYGYLFSSESSYLNQVISVLTNGSTFNIIEAKKTLKDITDKLNSVKKVVNFEIKSLSLQSLTDDISLIEALNEYKKNPDSDKLKLKINFGMMGGLEPVQFSQIDIKTYLDYKIAHLEQTSRLIFGDDKIFDDDGNFVLMDRLEAYEKELNLMNQEMEIASNAIKLSENLIKKVKFIKDEYSLSKYISSKNIIPKLKQLSVDMYHSGKIEELSNINTMFSIVNTNITTTIITKHIQSKETYLYSKIKEEKLNKNKKQDNKDKGKKEDNKVKNKTNYSNQLKKIQEIKKHLLGLIEDTKKTIESVREFGINNIDEKDKAIYIKNKTIKKKSNKNANVFSYITNRIIPTIINKASTYNRVEYKTSEPGVSRLKISSFKISAHKFDKTKNKDGKYVYTKKDYLSNRFFIEAIKNNELEADDFYFVVDYNTRIKVEMIDKEGIKTTKTITGNQFKNIKQNSTFRVYENPNSKDEKDYCDIKFIGTKTIEHVDEKGNPTREHLHVFKLEDMSVKPKEEDEKDNIIDSDISRKERVIGIKDDKSIKGSSSNNSSPTGSLVQSIKLTKEKIDEVFNSFSTNSNLSDTYNKIKEAFKNIADTYVLNIYEDNNSDTKGVINLKNKTIQLVLGKTFISNPDEIMAHEILHAIIRDAIDVYEDLSYDILKLKTLTIKKIEEMGISPYEFFLEPGEASLEARNRSKEIYDYIFGDDSDIEEFFVYAQTNPQLRSFIENNVNELIKYRQFEKFRISDDDGILYKSIKIILNKVFDFLHKIFNKELEPGEFLKYSLNKLTHKSILEQTLKSGVNLTIQTMKKVNGTAFKLLSYSFNYMVNKRIIVDILNEGSKIKDFIVKNMLASKRIQSTAVGSLMLGLYHSMLNSKSSQRYKDFYLHLLRTKHVLEEEKIKNRNILYETLKQSINLSKNEINKVKELFFDTNIGIYYNTPYELKENALNDFNELEKEVNNFISEAIKILSGKEHKKRRLREKTLREYFKKQINGFIKHFDDGSSEIFEELIAPPEQQLNIHNMLKFYNHDMSIIRKPDMEKYKEFLEKNKDIEDKIEKYIYLYSIVKSKKRMEYLNNIKANDNNIKKLFNIISVLQKENKEAFKNNKENYFIHSMEAISKTNYHIIYVDEKDLNKYLSIGYSKFRKDRYGKYILIKNQDGMGMEKGIIENENYKIQDKIGIFDSDYKKEIKLEDYFFKRRMNKISYRLLSTNKRYYKKNKFYHQTTLVLTKQDLIRLNKDKDLLDLISEAYIRNHTTKEVEINKINEKSIDLIMSQYQNEPSEERDKYVEISLNSNGAYNEYYKLLPYEIKEYIHNKYNGKIYIRPELLNDFIGYVNYSSSVFMRKFVLGKTDLNKLKMFKNIDTKKLAMIYKAINLGENLLKSIADISRNLMAVVSPTVLIGNIMSNIFIITLNSSNPYVSLKRYFKYIKYLNDLREIKSQIVNLEFELKNQPDNETIKKKKKILTNKLKNNPLYDIYKNGLISDVIDDVDITKQEKNIIKDTINEKILKKIKNKKLRKNIQEIISLFLGFEDSPIFKTFLLATIYSDTLAKAVIYKDLIDNGEDKETALVKASEMFVMYNTNLPKEMEYMNKIGAIMFMKFFFNNIRIVLDMFKKNIVTLTGYELNKDLDKMISDNIDPYKFIDKRFNIFENEIHNINTIMLGALN